MAIVLATAAALMPARDAGAQARSVVDTTFAFSRSGAIEVTVPSGDIIVTGWDRDQVRVHGSSQYGEVQVDASGSRLTVTVMAVRNRLGETRLEVSVPAGARVVMRALSGDLTARGIQGELTADATSGDIVVSEIGARASLTTTSGDVRGRQLAGRVTATAVSGNVVLEDVAGDVQANTTSGTIRLIGVRGPSVKAGTLNGNVEYDGTLEPGGRYSFLAHSGNVMLHLPPTAGAVLDVLTFSGHLESDFPVTLRDGIRPGDRIRFTIGDGGASVSAQTHNGNIIIRRSPRANR